MAQKFTVTQITKALPEYYQAIAGQTFTFSPSNHRFIVRTRVKDLDKKQPLYLYDLDANAFISSLYYAPHTGRFCFELMNGEHRKYYSLGTDMSIKPEDHGYYPGAASVWEILKEALKNA